MKKKKINKMYPFCTHIFVNTLEMIEYPYYWMKKKKPNSITDPVCKIILIINNNISHFTISSTFVFYPYI